MIEKLIDNFSEIMECDNNELTKTTSFRTHEGWDSLAYLSVIVMIDEEFNINIPQNEFKKLITIEDIANYIKQHKS